MDSNNQEKRYVGQKREDYMDWDDYFMAAALLSGQRSKDPCSQVGACIVNRDKRVVGLGYNGMPRGCSDDVFPWSKQSPDPLENKHLYVCHAELNAVLNKQHADLKDCTIYVNLFPCNECTKVIIQSGIKEVVYWSDKHRHKVGTMASKRMLQAAGIQIRQLIPKSTQVVIDFSECERESIYAAPSQSTNDSSVDQIATKTAQCSI